MSVKGRIEIVPVTKRYTLMIDYAHNAMALESLLTTLKEYEPGRLVCPVWLWRKQGKVTPL